MFGRKSVDFADMPEEFCSQNGPHSGQFSERGWGGVQGVAHLGLVVFDRPVKTAKVGDEIACQVAPTAVSRGDRPEPLDDVGGLHGGQGGGRASWYQVAQQDVEAIEQSGAFADQVIAAFGQQPKDHGLVFDADFA